MYAYEPHRLHSAELMRRAEKRRTVREAVLARRAARREERAVARTGGQDGPGGRVSEDPGRFAYAA
ncbi:hypothetical protein OG909_23405 [Streptomyces sp. NBC_01754]|uniref:hypothetical protein n=1 Tax=Streptomyces sp. NBC_01754 TaxID=2975930 RepID=UPI002DDC55DC|nr:hypothetical protein [Streptomyces sp. NBC_01754]WSC94984.1 hypothetical protein OG909_23405 [Streptomyces sp. NBC_01754]